MYLSELTGIKPATRKYRPSDTFIDPEGIFGVEIEVEFGRKQVFRPSEEMWKVDGDGSLRNNGAEYISVPMFGEDAIQALNEVEAGLVENPPELTHRCGLHVHIDVSALTVEQLLSMVVAVAFAEPALYKYVGIDRRNNIHCLPFSDTGNIMPWLNGIKYGQTSREISNSISNMCKYSGFNILPVMYQGSVEFRHHKGEYGSKAIIKWVNILQTLKAAALRHDAVDLSNMAPDAIKELLIPEGVEYTQEDYINGYITAKDILNFNRLEDGWELIKDEYGDDERLNFIKGA